MSVTSAVITPALHRVSILIVVTSVPRIPIAVCARCARGAWAQWPWILGLTPRHRYRSPVSRKIGSVHAVDWRRAAGLAALVAPLLMWSEFLAMGTSRY